MAKATLTCPFCRHKQKVKIPELGCLAFHQCEKCQEIITVPAGKDTCCVVCQYSDQKCPVGSLTKSAS